MKYKYIDKSGRLIAESDTVIRFNTKLFPIWKDLEPVIEKEGKKKKYSDYSADKEDK